MKYKAIDCFFDGVSNRMIQQGEVLELNTSESKRLEKLVEKMPTKKKVSKKKTAMRDEE